MKFLPILLFLTWTSLAKATPDLQVGDILLQPLDCWSCSLIEEEEESIYSHMGIVVSTNPVLVADSRKKVEVQSLEEFNSITEKNQKIQIMRFRNEDIVNALRSKSSAFLALFRSEFEGLSYDHKFLWNNFDENGNQTLYCSEMVAKLLQAFLGIDPIVKRMHFNRNTDQWSRYFHGDIPAGKWGNSPADFERSNLFYSVGEL